MEIARGDAGEVEGARRRGEEDAGDDEDEEGGAIEISHLELDLERELFSVRRRKYQGDEERVKEKGEEKESCQW